MADGPSAARARQTFRAKLAALIAGKPEEIDGPPADSGAPDASPRALRLRIDEFDSAVVADVMSARSEIGAIEVSATMGEVLKQFAEMAHTRMPVYREELDEPVGFIHIKDVVAEIARLGWTAETLECRPLERLKRDVLFVTPSMRLPDLLVEMQVSRTHIALVVDEYGGIDGIVALEDLVEQIVGDIEDEHDEAPPMVVRKGRTTWEADALALIPDVERETRLKLAVEAHEGDIETLGGLVTALAGRVPQPGEVVEHPLGHRFEVIETDDRRILRLKLRAAGPPKPPRVAEPADALQETSGARAAAEAAGEARDG